MSKLRYSQITSNCSIPVKIFMKRKRKNERLKDNLFIYNKQHTHIHTGGEPQGSVLGSWLWNIMYDGLLRVALPSEVKLVAYADDIAVVIVKYLEERILAFDITFTQISQ